jgi:hypothetical protein
LPVGHDFLSRQTADTQTRVEGSQMILKKKIPNKLLLVGRLITITLPGAVVESLPDTSSYDEGPSSRPKLHR